MIGYDDVIARERCKSRLNVFDGPRDSAHSARLVTGCRHQFAALTRDDKQVLFAEHAGCMEGRDLTEAVSRYGLGLDVQVRQ